MSDPPEWIEERVSRDLNNKLTQQHVVETMLEADRPFFSIRQIQARVKPDVGKGTVRNRLNELQEIDVVATETYPESITLYYVDHPESDWPLSPAGRRALTNESPLDRLSLRGFLSLRDTAGIRSLVLAGFQLSLVLLALGAVALVLGVDLGTSSDSRLIAAAFDLFAVSLLLSLLERAARWVRNNGWTPGGDR
ncbi:hypothetical protein ACFQMA_14365 [Halosimplex aquaticum]|uniref:Helix-turn-helix domain-containing protein n=1 Tax=Halosimplex aquaticum TaxID=3026162 RepID=A0ABD5Y5I2_9EURY|nr:hypothetical protein [Halosimplex aquaticum]